MNPDVNKIFNKLKEDKVELSAEKVELARIDPLYLEGQLRKIDSKLAQLEDETMKAFNTMKSSIKEMKGLVPDRRKVFDEIGEAFEKAQDIAKDLSENGIPTGQIDKIIQDLDQIYDEANDISFEVFVEEYEKKIY
jgi:uncharacterized phage infection (PIP) family protein YhgE